MPPTLPTRATCRKNGVRAPDTYQKIVVAISETIRIMKEIDEVIDKNGGWPGAFVAKATGAKK